MEFAPLHQQVTRKTFSSGPWTLEYAVLKNSEDRVGAVTFGFHGFARPLEDLQEVAKHWPHGGCFIAVHLLHHGMSQPNTEQIPEDSAIRPSELNEMLEAIARLEAPELTARRLFGYSIGGRIALALVHQSPTKWSGILLMAPDGLKKSPFYYLTVHTKIGRWAWFYIDSNAEKIKRWNNRLLRLGLISKHLHAFSEFHTVNHEMRMMVWNGWRAHRLCWPSHDELKAACESSCRIDLVFGERDKIIPPRNARRLQARTQNLPHIQFHLIPSGHGMLKEEVLIDAFQRIFPS